MTLTPAYGRDYGSKVKVVEAFMADKDFIVRDVTSPWYGLPVCRGDLMKVGIRTVTLRYRQARCGVVVEFV